MICAMRILYGAVAVALSVGLAGPAGAKNPQDPGTGGQLNKCWGDITQQQAKLPTPDGTHGGARGQHTRSTTAANINGGFVSDGNALGLTFNELNAEGNHGRAGVGNATRGFPHFAQPGDGGNGLHAINNGSSLNVDPLGDGSGGFSNTLNPTTGEATPNAISVPRGNGEVVDLTCDFGDAP